RFESASCCFSSHPSHQKHQQQHQHQHQQQRGCHHVLHPQAPWSTASWSTWACRATRSTTGPGGSVSRPTGPSTCGWRGPGTVTPWAKEAGSEAWRRHRGSTRTEPLRRV
ncbi:unnamed protein product, partial [Ectocarpus sp. 8 AP-2014]